MQKNNFEGYKIDFTSQASKKLKKMGLEIAKKVYEKLRILVSKNPHVDLKKMQGVENTYRIRFGEYRIIFEAKKNIITVLVIDVAHRKEVYRDY